MLVIPALVSTLFLSAMGVHGSSQCAVWKQKQGSSALRTTAQNVGGSRGYPGACGVAYNEGDRFVMLWNGINSNVQIPSTLTPGWVTGSNCGKRVRVFAPDGTHSDGTVLETGSFSPSGQPISEATGCSSISISNQMMQDLRATGASSASLQVTWQFLDTVV
ncbi:secreted protein [Melampsora americana]|nr:secreted protein [Melampsora americana]